MAEIAIDTLSCEQSRELLTAFCRGQTDEEDSFQIKDHLRGCKECHKRFLHQAAKEFFQRQDAARGKAERMGTASVAPQDWTLFLGRDRVPLPKQECLRTDPPFSTRDFPFVVSKCESIREIVEWLFCAAKRLGFKNVRYHFFSARDARLVSVDGAGHRPEIAARLRRGRILRRPTSAIPDDCDSYVCFHYDRPTVFQIDESKKGILEVGRLDDGLPHLQLPRDNCENVLVSSKDRIWVDVPMAGLGRFVGKLSCDLVATDIASIDTQKICEFWQFAQIAAPYLDGLYAATVNNDFEAVRDQLDVCKTLDDVLQYLTGPLARNVFRCKYANVFNLSQDSEGRRLLVFDKTSYPSIRKHERRTAYRCESTHFLVPWVARNKSGLRLNDLQDDRRRDEQCKAHEAGINWEDPLIDWSKIGSQLSAPIFASRDQVVGVIQFLNKRGGRQDRQGCFSDGDLRLIDRLGYELLGPKLDSMSAAEGACDLNCCVEWGERLSSLKTVDVSQIPEQLAELLESAVPEDRSRKLYVVGLLDEDRTRFSTWSVRGRMKKQFSARARSQLEQTITEREVPSVPRAVFWNELPQSPEPQPFNVACALACGISFRAKPLGAIVVTSDHYDLSCRHASYLERLAAAAGKALGSG